MKKITLGSDWDEIDPLLDHIKGCGIRVMSKATTTRRMGWILEALDISTAQFKNWCGYSTKDWKAMNKDFTEKDFCDLVCENYRIIKDV